MAISLAASSTFTVASGSGTEIKNLPGTPAQNDVVVIGRVNDGNLDTYPIVTSGYAELAPDTNSDTPGRRCEIKRLGASPDTTVEVPQWTGGRGTSGIIYLFRGVDPGVDLSLLTVDAEFGSTGLPNVPSHTTTVANAMRVAVGFLDDDAVAASITGLTGFTNIIAEDGGGDGTIMAATRLEATAGALDPPEFSSGSGSDGGYAIHFSLPPDTGGGGHTATGTLSLPLFQLSASSAQEIAASGALALTRAEVDATATFGDEPEGSATIALAGTLLAGAGIEEIPSTAAVSLAGAVIDATASEGMSSAASIALSAVELAAMGEEELAAQAVVALRQAVIDASADLSQPVSAEGAVIISSVILSAVDPRIGAVRRVLSVGLKIGL